jgi:hypothetical protein
LGKTFFWKKKVAKQNQEGESQICFHSDKLVKKVSRKIKMEHHKALGNATTTTGLFQQKIAQIHQLPVFSGKSGN